MINIYSNLKDDAD